MVNHTSLLTLLNRDSLHYNVKRFHNSLVGCFALKENMPLLTG